jgi:hypothetical protein
MTGRHPAPLWWAIRLLYLEGVGVGAVAAFLIYEDITEPADNMRAAISITVYAVAMAIALGGLAYALSRRRPWARGPSVALQLILLGVAYYVTTGGSPWFGVPIGLLGLAIAGLLITPSSTKALGMRIQGRVE